MQKVETHRWTREAYDRMIETGVLTENDRVELIDGEIVSVSPEGNRHVVAIQLSLATLQMAFGAGFDVRVQHPLALDSRSEPEPDLAVVPGNPRDYLIDHPFPDKTILIVEVSESSLAYDRTTKASLYARADIQEYWIVNLIDRQVEVYRNPRPADDSPLGFSYSDVKLFTPGASVTPLGAPNNSILIDDLLP